MDLQEETLAEIQRIKADGEFKGVMLKLEQETTFRNYMEQARVYQEFKVRVDIKRMLRTLVELNKEIEKKNKLLSISYLDVNREEMETYKKLLDLSSESIQHLILFEIVSGAIIASNLTFIDSAARKGWARKDQEQVKQEITENMQRAMSLSESIGIDRKQMILQAEKQLQEHKADLEAVKVDTMAKKYETVIEQKKGQIIELLKRGTPLSGNQIEDEVKGRKEIVTKALQELVDRGMVKKEEAGKGFQYIMLPPTSPKKMGEVLSEV